MLFAAAIVASNALEFSKSTVVAALHAFIVSTKTYTTSWTFNKSSHATNKPAAWTRRETHVVYACASLTHRLPT